MTIDWVPGNPNDRSISGFCIRHGGPRGPMSRKFYFDMKKKGLGPRETDLGSNRIEISVAAEKEWEHKRSHPTGTEAELVAKAKAMRRNRAMKAGAAGAASAKHVSRRKTSRIWTA
jgi:hypothetical protein